MTAIAIIPARYNSSRLPGKPLVDIAGKPLVYYVYSRVCQAKRIERVIVATDDARVKAAVEAFGGMAVMTAREHRTGTERVAEVASLMPHEIIVNVQVDEPLIRSDVLDSLIALLESDPSVAMATLATPVQDLDELDDPNVVKVVLDMNGYALYFSRSAIPYPFLPDTMPSGYPKEIVSYRNDLIRFYQKHIGVYAFRRDALIKLVTLPPTPLEQLERLEQLRALEHGFRIKVLMTLHHHLGIDTQEELQRFRNLVTSRERLITDENAFD